MAIDDWNREGRAEADVLAELRERLADDLTYASGRIVGTMISAPHPFAEAVFRDTLEKNLGDPGLYPGSAELEREAVRWLGGLLSDDGATGRLVSGGSEANLLALWAARDLRRERGRRVILSETAHVSYEKAARLLDLELHAVPLDDRGRMDAALARAAITDDTIAIVGAAGSTDLGTVDPIAELSDLAVRHDLHLHVDAAFGGFVLPFLEELGEPAPAFDFRLPGVASITIDPHKMGLCIQPAGAVLLRDERVAGPLLIPVSYLAGGPTVHATVTGTRSGAAVLAVWALMRHLGRDGYRQLVRDAMAETRWLRDRVREIAGCAVVVEPQTNILGVRGPMPAADLADALRARGWGVSCFPGHIRIVVLPHLRRAHLEALLDDLRAVVAGARAGG